MRRRRQILVAGGALVLWPIAGVAQRTQRLPRIGFVSSTAAGRRDEAFVQGLRELGYAEGNNVHLEMRFAEGRPERFAELVEELLRLKVDMLVVGGTIGARAAKNATTTIPVVFVGSSDPVAGGIVTNLARPEGNITGISMGMGDGVAGKWLQLLKEAIPGISHCAALWSSSNVAAATVFVDELQAAARGLKVRLDMHRAVNLSELEAAFAAIGNSGAQGLLVVSSPFAATQQEKLIRFAATRRLPAMYFTEDFAEAGGLMSYGPSFADVYRRAAAYVDRILKGAKPGDLPVEQPTKFDLVVNLKTAKALGLAIPQSTLLRAARVIQ